VLPLADALSAVLADVEALPPERIRLEDAAGRVLASAQHAPLTLPAWDNSAMDGYAVRGTDIDGATADQPVSLRVLETVAAGRFATRRVGDGEAIRIMTGAPLPEGADTVVRVEDTDGGTSQVLVRSSRDARRNVRPRGEDFREGDALPIAGVDGSIANRMRGTAAAGNVHAKTGFVDKARSLSGYVTTANGRVLLFSFLCNNWTTTSREVDQVADAIAVRLAGFTGR
jgi:molybdopterin biosynthesis enzyme